MTDTPDYKPDYLDITDDPEARNYVGEIIAERAKKEWSDVRIAELSEYLVERYGDYKTLRWTDDSGMTHVVGLQPETLHYYPDLEGLAWCERFYPHVYEQITTRKLDAAAFNAAVESGLINRDMLNKMLPVQSRSDDGTPTEFKPAKRTRPLVRITHKKPARTKTAREVIA